MTLRGSRLRLSRGEGVILLLRVDELFVLAAITRRFDATHLSGVVCVS